MPVSVQHSPPPLHQPGEVTQRPKGEFVLKCEWLNAPFHSWQSTTTHRLIRHQAFSRILLSLALLGLPVTILKLHQHEKTPSPPQPPYPLILKTPKRSPYKTPCRMPVPAAPPPRPVVPQLQLAAIHQPILTKTMTTRRTCA
jgi:hypothetical protein